MEREKNEQLNGYTLSRQWFDYAFENPEKIKSHHAALWFWIIELCNRFGWKGKFGLPTVHSMEVLGIKSYNTYKATLSDLVKWGFIVLVEKSRNQYTSNIIALSYFNNAQYKALDKALLKHRTDHNDIYKQEETIQTNKPITSDTYSTDYTPINVFDSLSNQLWQQCYADRISKNIKPTMLLKAKPPLWANEIRLMIDNDKRTESEIIEVLNFLKNDEFWKSNIQSTVKLRQQFEKLQLKMKQPPKKRPVNSYSVGNDLNLNMNLTKSLHGNI